MIPATTLGRHPASPPTWQQELAGAITRPADLALALGLDPGLFAAAGRASELFGLRVPLSFVRRMRPGDPSDPLLRQVMPVAAELVEQPGFRADPLSEREAFKAPGLLQKYQGRALLIATGACAINCRYCFRREFPYSEQIGSGPLQEALEAIAADSSIEEVILSGGDPLSLSDARLRALTDRLRRLPHLRRLRVHTRLPVVLPSRVDAGLLEWLRDLPWPVAVVLHSNHGNEIDDEVRAASTRLRAAGCHAAEPVGAAAWNQRFSGRARGSVTASVCRRRRALLPASAGSGARRGALRSARRYRAATGRRAGCDPLRLPGPEAGA